MSTQSVKWVVSVVLAAMLGLGAPAVVSSPIVCESTDDGRYMEISFSAGSASCFASGSTPPPEGNFHEGLGFVKLEKLEDDDVPESVTDGSLSGSFFSVTGLGDIDDKGKGTFEFVSGFYDLYENVHMVFKFGAGTLTPDWFSYSLEGVQSGSWELFQSSNPLQALSHVTVYADRKVPEPGVLGLLGLGLLGLFVVRRRAALRAAR